MDTYLLSKYRQSLFGLAALGILCVHSTVYVEWPFLISRILGMGGIGVYTFAFLSGMGLHHSLTKSEQSMQFYLKRFFRVGVPYLLIAGIWYFIKHIVISFSPLNFFYELSTLSFWIEHKGAWYVAMLIPMYIIYPFYYRMIENGNRLKRTIMSISFLEIFSLLLYFNNRGMYVHLIQVINSFIVISIGNYVGEKLNSKKKVNKVFVFICTCFYPIRAIIPNIDDIRLIGDLSYALLGVALCLWAAVLFNKMPPLITQVFERMGNLSLELYLTNIFLLQGLRMIIDARKLLIIERWYQWMILYLIVCILGGIWSRITRIVVNKLTKTEMFKK